MTAHDRAVAALDEAMWAEPISPQAHTMTVEWLDAILADPAKVAALLAVLPVPESMCCYAVHEPEEVHRLTTTEEPS